jgi:hypothetical protein
MCGSASAVYQAARITDEKGQVPTMLKTAFSSSLAGIGIATAIAATSFVPAATRAAAADSISIQYDLYTRGMRAFALSYDAEITGDAYSATARLRPKGLASLVVDLKMDMKSSGTVNGNGAESRAFSMGVKESGKNGAYSVRFNGMSPVASERKPGVDGKTEAKLEEAAAAGVRDTLASIVNLAVSSTDNPCTGDHRVYNGKEVFKLSLSKIKDDTFHDKDGGVYRGPAVVCRMGYSSIAGLSDKTMAKYRKNPPVFNVWFAPVQSRTLNRPVHVLVGVTGKLKGKDFVAYANRATINGKPFNNQSMANK